jgi:hypothetical protein
MLLLWWIIEQEVILGLDGKLHIQANEKLVHYYLDDLPLICKQNVDNLILRNTPGPYSDLWSREFVLS